MIVIPINTSYYYQAMKNNTNEYDSNFNKFLIALITYNI